jgi:glutaredoxin
MGSVIRLVVLAAIVAVVARFVPDLVALYTGQPLAVTGEAPAEEPAPLADAAVSDLADRDVEPPPAAERTYYRYMDAGGSLHFVDSLERVPEAFRASARPLSMSADKGDAAPPLTRAAASTAQQRRRFSSAAAQPPAARARTRGVVVYTTSWCGWCRKTMAWLNEKGVPYENRDIERNPAFRDELVEKTGGTSIPVVEIDGELIRGFSPGRMAELL